MDIKRIKCDGSSERELVTMIQSRASETDRKVSEIVDAIIQDVRVNGDEAVNKYTLKFDGKVPESYEVPREVINDALTSADPDFVEALLNAQANIADFHNRQREESFINAKENGVMLGQRVRGLKRVAVYVPGGTAAYPSSVLMNVIPAKIAGVQEIVMLTPPMKDGGANPDILVAAAIAGVDRVFLAGGAQAIAAAAYGTETFPKVDKIVGPGNIFVATAKKMLYGVVDIDMIAGPSEILVIADESANPEYVAADMLSQAEHDKIASAILITTSESIADAVELQLERQIATLPRRDIAETSIREHGIIAVCDSLSAAAALADEIAPEHLELAIAQPFELLGSIQNAGSVFMGHYTPESLGDYLAGPNHVLPTGGTAAFYSPLSVYDFVKRSSFIYYTRDALLDDSRDIVTIAEREGLTAHANAVRVRVKDEKSV